MLAAQQNFFTARKLGYTDDKPLLMAKTAENTARNIFKQLHYNRPQIIEADIKTMVDDYNKFLDATKELIIAQVKYFEDTRNPTQLQKCKALEKRMRERIKLYLSRQPQQQLDIFH